MVKPPRADYCLEINFQKGSPNPSRIFQSMSELIDAFQNIDKSLVKCIDAKIEPILMLEDIEVGSIKTWLSNALEKVDDEALRNLDWRPQVGKYLVKGKYAMIDFLKGKTSIGNINDIRPLENELHRLARETDVRWLPVYSQIDRRSLLEGIQQISSPLSHLQKGDSASYITDDASIGFNLEFHLAPESIEELFVNKTISSPNEMILKIKKPDYLGDSMWEFRHGNRNIPAKISDKEWVERFQSRKVMIQPGDSVIAVVQITYKYDAEGELLSTNYDVTEVKEVLPLNQDQLKLLSDDDAGP